MKKVFAALMFTLCFCFCFCLSADAGEKIWLDNGTAQPDKNELGLWIVPCHQDSCWYTGKVNMTMLYDTLTQKYHVSIANPEAIRLAVVGRDTLLVGINHMTQPIDSLSPFTELVIKGTNYIVATVVAIKETTVTARIDTFPPPPPPVKVDTVVKVDTLPPPPDTIPIPSDTTPVSPVAVVPPKPLNVMFYSSLSSFIKNEWGDGGLEGDLWFSPGRLGIFRPVVHLNCHEFSGYTENFIVGAGPGISFGGFNLSVPVSIDINTGATGISVFALVNAGRITELVRLEYHKEIESFSGELRYQLNKKYYFGLTYVGKDESIINCRGGLFLGTGEKGSGIDLGVLTDMHGNLIGQLRGTISIGF